MTAIPEKKKPRHQACCRGGDVITQPGLPTRAEYIKVLWVMVSQHQSDMSVTRVHGFSDCLYPSQCQSSFRGTDMLLKLHVCARRAAWIFSLGKAGFWAWSMEASAKRKAPVFSSPRGVMHSPRQWKTVPRAFPITHTPRCQRGHRRRYSNRQMEGWKKRNVKECQPDG